MKIDEKNGRRRETRTKMGDRAYCDHEMKWN